MRTIDFFTFSRLLTGKQTRLNNDILLVIDDGIQFFRRHTQQISNLIRQRTEIPDVSNRNDKFDMSATLTTNLLLCNLYTTTITNDSLITDALVFTTAALIVFRRTENTFTEQTITFGLVRTIINGFGLGYLTKRIFQDLFGRSKTDGNLREIILYLCIFFKSHAFKYLSFN